MNRARLIVVFLAALSLGSTVSAQSAPDRPNILWLTFEDTSASNFACYGNPHVKTPVTDDLARRGILFERACSVAPYCSPARSTIIAGAFATTYGTDIHRHNWQVPAEQYFFPRLLRAAGYYCTNNSKTDYNAANEKNLLKDVWDESSPTASYNNGAREKYQPFFAVFNNGTSHMTRVHTYTTEDRTPEIDPATVQLLPFVPDLPEIRSDYARHLESTQDIDRWIKIFLDDLEQRKLADDTIVFVFSDHGGVLPRGKAFPYETGMRPPMIVYVPEKWRSLCGMAPGTRSNRLVGFEDLAATVLTLAGLDVPHYMQGRSFLAPGAEPKPIQFGFRTNTGPHFDPIRTATDGRFKYIRSFTPYKPLGLRQSYQWGVPGQMAWDKAYFDGKLAPEHRSFFEPKPAEQLFDLQNDPWEMHDLASDPSQQERLAHFRAAVAKHMRDTVDLGLFPRSLREKPEKISLYEWVRTTRFPVNDLIEAAEIASAGDPAHLPKLIALMNSEHSALRFWGASGCLTLAAAGTLERVPGELVALMKDESDDIAATSAEALCRAGRADDGLPVLLSLLENGSAAAGSSLEELREVARPLVPRLHDMTKQQPVRSILITLGELPHADYYGGKSYEQGRARNARDPEWRFPTPDPEANRSRPAEESGD